MRILVLLLMATVLACHARVLEEWNLPDGTQVRLSAPLNVLPSGGFLPVRAEVSGPEAVALTLESRATLRFSNHYFPGFGRSSNEEGVVSSRFDLKCPAGETRQLDLLVPVPQASASDEVLLNLSIRGVDSRAIYSTGLSCDPSEQRFAMSSEVYRRFWDQLRSIWSPRKKSGRSTSFSDLAGTFEVTKLPGDWRAYAGYDALIFTRADLEKVSPGVKVALEQWVRSGGHLIVLNDGEDAGGVSRIQTGFGQRTVIECGEQYQGCDPKDLVARLRAGTTPWTEVSVGQYLGRDWPLGEALGARTLQTGLLLFALIIFAVVVGPVNLFRWADKNRRHRLFVTTPLISLVASLVMVTFIILRDGFGGEGSRAIAIEVGSPDDKTAVIVQEQFSRSGILFSSDFSLDDQSVLIPLRPPLTDLNRGDSPSAQGTFHLGYERTQEGWEVKGNLFESRSEQAQLIRSVVPSREGLTLISEAGENPRLTSAFSYVLGPVFYTDDAGQVWKAGAIEPGGTVSLEASYLREQKDALTVPISRFGASYRTTLQRLILRPNSFSALAEEAPGVETHSSVDWKNSPVVVTGLTVR